MYLRIVSAILSHLLEKVEYKNQDKALRIKTEWEIDSFTEVNRRRLNLLFS